jgi:glyoxylase-like metal-dependent hydrolase (beta-lactamase superfamily II)
LLAQERDLGLVPEPYRVDRVLADGERIVLGDETIRIVATPGHSDDHICVLLEQSRTLFAGDLFTYEDVGTFDINHHHAVSLQTMLATIDRCAALRPLCVAPGHGRPVRNPGRLFETAAKRMKLFARSPSIMVAHTLMPLVMLLIEARGVADIEDIRRHTREHAPLFEDFLAGAVSIEDELDRILLVLAMKGVVAIDGTRVFLRADALAQAA